MKKRIQMRSENLQNLYPDVYKDFFKTSDLVLSSCFSFVWTPVGIGNHSSVFYIKQKVPTRIYISIDKRKDKKIVFNDVMFFDITKDEFHSVKFNEINKREDSLQDLLMSFLVENGQSYGLDINILCENTRGHGLGFSGTAGGVLAVGMYLLAGKLTISDLEDYDGFVKGNTINDIHNLGWKFDYISRYGSTSGENSYFALMEDSVPMFYMSEKITKDTELEDLNYVKKHYFNLNKKFSESEEKFEIPIDYALIFSGIESRTHQVERYRKFDMEKEKGIKEFTQKHFGDILDEKLNLGINDINKEGAILDAYNKNVLFLNLQFLNIYNNMISGGFDPANIENFINHINNNRYAISLVERQNNFAQIFRNLFENNKSKNDEMLGIMPVYSGKMGGGYLVLTKQNYSRDTLYKIIDDIQDIYPNCEIEYCVWEDGLGGGGVKIDQYISKQRFSKFVEKGNVSYRDNQGNSYIGDFANISKREKSGILLDAINKKIYIDGEKLTSKDLVSQSSTVEVLDILMDNLAQEVHNYKFPVSGYSKNKSEMLSKIIIPLVKLTSKKYGKKLELICKGSLRDFYIKLSEAEIKIGVVKKIV